MTNDGDQKKPGSEPEEDDQNETCDPEVFGVASPIEALSVAARPEPESDPCAGVCAEPIFSVVDYRWCGHEAPGELFSDPENLLKKKRIVSAVGLVVSIFHELNVAISETVPMRCTPKEINDDTPGATAGVNANAAEANAAEATKSGRKHLMRIDAFLILVCLWLQSDFVEQELVDGAGLKNKIPMDQPFNAQKFGLLLADSNLDVDRCVRNAQRLVARLIESGLAEKIEVRSNRHEIRATPLLAELMNSLGRNVIQVLYSALGQNTPEDL